MFYGSDEADADGYGPEPEVHLHISRNAGGDTEVDFAVPWATGSINGEAEIEADVGDNQWHYAYASWESNPAAPGEITLTIDDRSVAASIMATPGFGFDQVVRLGRPGASTRYYDGDLDEVRLHAAPRTPAWVELDNRSIRDELIEYGPEEEL